MCYIETSEEAAVLLLPRNWSLICLTVFLPTQQDDIQRRGIRKKNAKGFKKKYQECINGV